MPHTPESPLRLPPTLRKKLGSADEKARVSAILRQANISTVCEEARCPNIGECFSSGTATFMILGDRCTRRCHFCNVKTARPRAVDPEEPQRLADAAAALGLSHVVVTSVDRDELADKGARHWAACIRALHAGLPHAVVEVLVPDFAGKPALWDMILEAKPDVFNHNLETVPRLYQQVRPQSRWEHSSAFIAYARKNGFVTKSGIMVGLGEDDDEVLHTLEHMAALGVNIATIGQYLRPSLSHWAVQRYVDDTSYEAFRTHGVAAGIDHVFAGAFVRSSYHAAEAHRSLPARTARHAALPILS